MTPGLQRRGWAGRLGNGIFLLAMAAMLLLPLLGHVFGGPATQSDNRRLTEAPGRPASLDALVEWPRRVDAFLNDHFGFRPLLVAGDVFLRWQALHSSPSPSVVVGRNGRLFLANGEVPVQVLLGNCGAWWPEEYIALFSREMAQALPRLRQRVPGLSILVVPTSSILYPQDLPSWIERACAGHAPLVEQILQRLPGDMRQMLAYPRDIAAMPPAADLIIPLHNFHWAGAGIQVFMNSFAERDMHLSPHLSPSSWVEQSFPADLAVYIPGADLSIRVRMPNWSAADLRACHGDACSEAAPLEGVALPVEIMRLIRSGEGGKLLLLSDSFGAGAANALIGHFSDIVMINMNNFGRLSPEERRALWDRVTVAWQPDRVLMLVNDGNITLVPRYTDLIPDAPGG